MNSEKLEQIVTPDSVVELLMLTGLHDEAAWFSRRLGDWRATLLLSITCEHQKIGLPNHLRSSFILKDRIVRMLELEEREDPFDALNSFGDLLMASLFVNHDIVPVVAESLMLNLNNVIGSLRLIVDSRIYLPAPPLYCPQVRPQVDSSGDETTTRSNVSAIVRRLLALFRASVFAVPSSVWYVNRLQALWKSYVSSSVSNISIMRGQRSPQTFLAMRCATVLRCEGAGHPQAD